MIMNLLTIFLTLLVDYEEIKKRFRRVLEIPGTVDSALGYLITRNAFHLLSFESYT